jgi:Lrp/AsnC family transcriptional regulator, leucine-responsive regulatory protein
MDEIDRKIIGELVKDGRLSVTELSDQINLSLSATSQRLRQLAASGVIDHFTAVLNPTLLGCPIDALVDLRLPAENPFSEIDTELMGMDEVVDAVHLTGRFDYQVRLRCVSIDALDLILRDFKERLGVDETSTRLVLSSVKGYPRQPVPPQ